MLCRGTRCTSPSQRSPYLILLFCPLPSRFGRSGAQVEGGAVGRQWRRAQSTCFASMKTSAGPLALAGLLFHALLTGERASSAIETRLMTGHST